MNYREAKDFAVLRNIDNKNVYLQMTSMNFWLVIFLIALYLIITDQKFSIQFYIFFKYLGVEIQRRIMMIQYHPFWIRNPIGQWLMLRKYQKIVSQLEKELTEN